MNKFSRNVMAVVLSTSMILPLAGCNSKKSDKRVKNEVVKEDDPYFSVKKATLDFTPEGDKEIEYKSISNPLIAGDMVIASYQVNYKIPDSVLKELDQIGFDSDDNCQKYSQITEGYYESGTLYFDFDGKLIKKDTSTTGEDISAIYPQPDGSFIKAITQYTEGECKTTTMLRHCDAAGNTIKDIPLEGVEDMWNAKLFVLDNGNILLGSGTSVYLLNGEGKQINQVTINNYYGQMYSFDGKYYVYMEEFNEQTMVSKCTFQEIDPATLELKGKPEETKISAWELVQGKDGCYSMSSNEIKSVNPLTGESEKVLDWNWVDYNPEHTSSENCLIKSADEMVLFESYWDEVTDLTQSADQHFSIIQLSREAKNPHAGKTIIELGMMSYVDSALKDYIIEYNTEPAHKSRILTRSYADELNYDVDPENPEKTYAELIDKVYLDLLSGDGPDILMDFSEYNQFNNEQVLVDLNKYIDGQNGLNREEYFDNVFRAFETKGKMYQIPICVDITGFVSSSDIVGNRSGWTYEEFENVISSLPKNTSVFPDGMSSSTLLQSMISVASDSFIDYETKTVNFDTAEFKKLLEISKKYATNDPVQENNYGGMVAESGAGAYTMEGPYSGEPEVDPLVRIANGMLALNEAYIFSLDDIANVKEALKGKEVFLGMPSPNGSGMSARPMMTLAISAQSKHVDEAWDFIRFMFNEDQQVQYSKNFVSIPVNRAALDRRNAEQIEQVKEYNKLMGQKDPETSVDYSKMGMMTDINEDDAKELVKLVENVSTISSTDLGIMLIINEEVPAYFKGQRSAEDVCKNIQNRATTKVHER
ncbi:MAG: extracellular solute-binding protein [Clostridiales bacterium]|nr:extracellular solute-binding protein [Clostridiales bacterium]